MAANNKKDSVALAPVPTHELVATEAGVASVMTREAEEIKGAIVMAHHVPRDELVAFTKMKTSCGRPAFAEGARYLFPRGGTPITGPSVKLAREMARCWGNLRYGVRQVAMDADTVHIKGWAWDLETNAYCESEAKFNKLIPRKDNQTGETRWIEPNERDLREMVGRHGAICYRNAILQLMPPDYIEDCLMYSRKTLEKAAKGEIEEDRDRVVRSLAAAFGYYGVTPPILETHLGHPLAQINAEEVATLKEIYVAIKDGQTTVHESFNLDGSVEVVQEESTRTLDEQLMEPEPAESQGQEDLALD